MDDIVERLRISRTYVRGPGDIGYDQRGEHDKHDGKPVGYVENERREAADEIERLRAEIGDAMADYFRRHKEAVDCFEGNVRLRTVNTEARDTLQAVLHRLPNNSKWQALAQRVEGAIAVLRP